MTSRPGHRPSAKKTVKLNSRADFIARVEAISNVDPVTGQGDWIYTEGPRLPENFPSPGNGHSALRFDEPIAIKYRIVKVYEGKNPQPKMYIGQKEVLLDWSNMPSRPTWDKGANLRLVAWRVAGFRHDDLVEPSKLDIPDWVRKKLAGRRCAICNSKHKLEIDHIAGHLRQTDSPEALLELAKTDIDAVFQVLCKSCNDKKREDCKKCGKSGKRPDARILRRSLIAYTQGDKAWTEKTGCDGCARKCFFAFDQEERLLFMKATGALVEGAGFKSAEAADFLKAHPELAKPLAENDVSAWIAVDVAMEGDAAAAKTRSSGGAD